ncbi:MAG TPA: extensin family protein [Polyangiaceae bacterium]|nr:extensin family protein [Polyangiaceae bacterium]
MQLGSPFLALAAGVLAGCATVPPLPAPTPELPLAAWEGGTTASKNAPQGSGGRRAPSPALAKTAERGTADAPSSPRLAPRATTAPSPIPGGATCLSELKELGVPFRTSEPVLGIATPIVLAGNLDGIRFYASDHRPFLADCRLVLALRRVTPDLRALGVSSVRFSGAYVYKLTHPGRMSMHAFGLAADLHAFEIHGTTLEVKRDFARGMGCRDGLPVLNQIACRIRARGLFKEQLGPDDNAAHFDHFHVGLKPLPGELADDLPLPAAPKPVKRATRVNAPRRNVSARSAR